MAEGWRAWGLDAGTWAVIVWLVWFIGWETWALVRGSYIDTFTAHFRPLFLSHPLTWFLGMGFWLWFGVHTFAPDLERWLIDVVGRGTPHT